MPPDLIARVIGTPTGDGSTVATPPCATGDGSGSGGSPATDAVAAVSRGFILDHEAAYPPMQPYQPSSDRATVSTAGQSNPKEAIQKQCDELLTILKSKNKEEKQERLKSIYSVACTLGVHAESLAKGDDLKKDIEENLKLISKHFQPSSGSEKTAIDSKQLKFLLECVSLLSIYLNTSNSPKVKELLKTLGDEIRKTAAMEEAERKAAAPAAAIPPAAIPPAAIPPAAVPTTAAPATTAPAAAPTSVELDTLEMSYTGKVEKAEELGIPLLITPTSNPEKILTDSKDGILNRLFEMIQGKAVSQIAHIAGSEFTSNNKKNAERCAKFAQSCIDGLNELREENRHPNIGVIAALRQQPGDSANSDEETNLSHLARNDAGARAIFENADDQQRSIVGRALNEAQRLAKLPVRTDAETKELRLGLLIGAYLGGYAACEPEISHNHYHSPKEMAFIARNLYKLYALHVFSEDQLKEHADAKLGMHEFEGKLDTYIASEAVTIIDEIANNCKSTKDLLSETQCSYTYEQENISAGATKSRQEVFKETMLRAIQFLSHSGPKINTVIFKQPRASTPDPRGLNLKPENILNRLGFGESLSTDCDFCIDNLAKASIVYKDLTDNPSRKRRKSLLNHINEYMVSKQWKQFRGQSTGANSEYRSNVLIQVGLTIRTPVINRLNEVLNNLEAGTYAEEPADLDRLIKQIMITIDTKASREADFNLDALLKATDAVNCSKTTESMKELSNQLGKVVRLLKDNTPKVGDPVVKIGDENDQNYRKLKEKWAADDERSTWEIIRKTNLVQVTPIVNRIPVISNVLGVGWNIPKALLLTVEAGALTAAELAGTGIVAIGRTFAKHFNESVKPNVML